MSRSKAYLRKFLSKLILIIVDILGVDGRPFKKTTAEIDEFRVVHRKYKFYKFIIGEVGARIKSMQCLKRGLDFFSPQVVSRNSLKSKTQLNILRGTGDGVVP